MSLPLCRIAYSPAALAHRQERSPFHQGTRSSSSATKRDSANMGASVVKISWGCRTAGGVRDGSGCSPQNSNSLLKLGAKLVVLSHVVKHDRTGRSKQTSPQKFAGLSQHPHSPLNDKPPSQPI